MEIDDSFLEKRPLSYSSLKEFKKSPQHYIEYVFRKREATPAMFFGTLCEARLITDDFEKKYMVADKPDLRTKEGKLTWATILEAAQNSKKILVSTEDWERSKLVVENAMKDKYIKLAVEGKRYTQRLLKYRNKKYNLPLIGYSDLESNFMESFWCFDVKTVGQSADPDEFMRTVYKMDYHLQQGVYSEGYKRGRFQFPNFGWIVLETTEPYGCSLIQFPGKEVQEAVDEVNGLLCAFRKCMDEKRFDESYSFRLHGTKEYFSGYKPGYYKPKYTAL